MSGVHRELAGSVILDLTGRFLIQRRDDNPKIIYPRKFALFGGSREGEESLLECAMREFREELTLDLPADRFEHFLTYEGPDLDIAGNTSRVQAFVVRNVSIESLAVTEGELLVMDKNEILLARSQFVPLPLMILEAFFCKDGNEN